MARKTFFSFKYKDDVSRAMVVRNSWVTQEKKRLDLLTLQILKKLSVKVILQ